MNPGTARGLRTMLLLTWASGTAWTTSGCSEITGLSDLQKCGVTTCRSDDARAADGTVPTTDAEDGWSSGDVRPDRWTSPFDVPGPDGGTGEPEVEPLPDGDTEEDVGGDTGLHADAVLHDQGTGESTDALDDVDPTTDSASDGSAVCDSDVIDDMEGISPNIKPQCGRDGFWKTSAFGQETVIAPAKSTELFTGTVSRYLRVYGHASPGRENAATVGLSFHADGSAYDITNKGKGIRFHARAVPPVGQPLIRVRFSIVQENARAEMCLSDCTQPLFDFSVGSRWATFEVPFEELVSSGLNPVAFDPKLVTGLLFTMPQSSYDFQIDDVSFY